LRKRGIELAPPDLLVLGHFALANFLASRSLGNVSVALACARFPRGSSNETYHVPWDLSAMTPSRGLRRRLTAVGVRCQPQRANSHRRPDGAALMSGLDWQRLSA